MRILTLAAFALILCSVAHSQNLKWSAFLDTSTTFSSPRGVDLNNDGILDIVIGGGVDGSGESNGVNALNGADGSVLWNFPVNEEMFGSAKFMDITGDNIDDIFIGGRYAEFYAINGSTGTMIWEFFAPPPTQAVDSGWFNFYNPQFIPDQNSDGTPDILVANGGNHSLPSWDTLREPGMLMVLDALTGNVLAMDTMPDGEETYCSPVVVDYSGQLHIIYGSGGENDKGSLWRTTLTDLMADNLESSTPLATDPSLGFIAPSSIADMNGDGVLDIVNQAYDGTIRCFDGSNNALLWEVVNPGTESSSGPAIGNFTGDGTPDVFNVLYKGLAPSFTDFYQVMIDGATGSVVFKDSIGNMHYGSSSAVDMNLDGRDEIVMSLNYNNGASFSHQLMSIDFENEVIAPMYLEEPGVNLAATPMIEDIDNNGYLDFIFAYRADSLNPMGQNGFYVKCLEGTNTIPGVGVAWGHYQGTNTDGHYNYEGVACGLNVTSAFQNITCNHAGDGTATVTPTTGVAPYTYLWNTGDITNSIDSMDVGQYTVRITDSTGCYNDVIFNASDPYVISFGGIFPPACPGDSTGGASVNSSGCPCMFNSCVFDWDSGDSTKIANQLSSGWQIVTITHLDGCVVIDSVLLPEATPVLDSVHSMDVLCATDPYASSFIELFPQDSTNTLISWNTGDSTVYVDSLYMGMYYVDLNDTIRGCIYSDSVYIDAVDTLNISINASNLLCNNDSTGMIVANVSGGYPSYAYTWSNGDSIASTLNLVAGYYGLSLVDSVGCTASVDSILISQPDPLNVNVISSWNDSTGTCVAGAIGLANGGTVQYAFVWNDIASTVNDTVTGLCAGTYVVTVTDNNGCVAQDSVQVHNTLSVDYFSYGEFMLYPNPTNGEFKIEFKSDQFLNKWYTIRDATGRLILRKQIKQLTINERLGSEESGVYYLTIEGEAIRLPIMKQ